MNSETDDEFWECYYKLPEQVRRAARRAYALWAENNFHPGLHFKQIGESSIYSVRVGRRYRALGLKIASDTIVWYWIGTHAEYDMLIEQL